jgi:hypothetical protein
LDRLRLFGDALAKQNGLFVLERMTESAVRPIGSFLRRNLAKWQVYDENLQTG